MNKRNFFSLYYLDVSSFLGEKFLSLYEQVSKERQIRINQVIKEEEKRLLLGSYVLLAHSLKLYSLNIDDYEMIYNEHHKPLLFDCPFEFNISHSGNYVILAISDKPIGVDIQNSHSHDGIAERFFNDIDNQYINQSKDKEKAFYFVWCSKEAYLKNIGLGLSYDLKKVSIDYSKRQIDEINLLEFNLLNGYEVVVATPYNTASEIKQIKL